MVKNVGKADRIIRIIAGLTIIGIGIATGSWWGAIGIVPIIPAVIGHCPAYPLFGLNTCSLKGKDKV